MWVHFKVQVGQIGLGLNKFQATTTLLIKLFSIILSLLVVGFHIASRTCVAWERSRGGFAFQPSIERIQCLTRAVKKR